MRKQAIKYEACTKKTTTTHTQSKIKGNAFKLAQYA